MTLRDGTGREEGGGFRMGNMCIPVAIHVDIWQNQYNTVKSKNKMKLKKIKKCSIKTLKKKKSKERPTNTGSLLLTVNTRQLLSTRITYSVEL